MLRGRWSLLVACMLALLLAACEAPGEGGSEPGPTAAPTGVSSTGSGSQPGGVSQTAGTTMTPLAKPSSGGKTMLTRLERETTGIIHQNDLPLEFSGPHLHSGAGLAAGDYDNDGLPDLYLVSQAGENKLYRNLGDWHFEDVTQAAGVDVKRDVEAGRWKRRFPMGAYFVDYDNDGDLDLFVTAFAGANTLFRNEGNGKFSDVTEQAGVGYVGASTAATFADYDRDGDVDMYVATYRPYNATKYYPPGSHTEAEPELHYDIEPRPGGSFFIAEPDLLYRNKGDGTFEEVSRQAGLGNHRDWGLGAIFADATGDGWPDLYVANDFETPDRFYVNNRDGSFHEMAHEEYRHSPWFSMGVDFGDINNDGQLDYMTSDMMSHSRMRRQTQTMLMLTNPDEQPPPGSAPQVMRNSLFLNQGDGMFSDITTFAGVQATDWTWTAKFADLDLDGLMDLLITNGFVMDAMNSDLHARVSKMSTQDRMEFQRRLPRLLTPNLVFRNTGALRFEDMSDQWGFNDENVTHGLALADFDGDGDQDVAINEMNAPAGIYRNDATNHRLKVALRGQASNRYGLGARITLDDGQGGMQMREMTVSGGYLSSHEPIAVFGLGEAKTVPKLSVDWPSGHRSELVDVAANQLVTITEPDGPAEIPPPPTAVPAQFTEVAGQAGVDYTHTESAFDDFKAQPLLPYKLSQFGPGVAWGDADGDGWDDLYLAGTNGHPGGLYHNKAGQGFEAQAAPAPPAAGLEEQAVLWWPGSGGKGSDLVTSLSSVEAMTTAARTHPIARRLVSSGGGLAPDGWAPQSASSGSALAAADYDGDGDLDLFVGGRVQPGRYPLPTASHLYRNDGGTLVEAASDAPGLARIGLVTGAVWTDADGDGDPDLALATDWGPVRLLVNEGGKLADGTQAAGLAGAKGWWNGIAAGDVDHDGDLDLVATNLGLNTKYQATDEAPQVLYGGDLDGDGNSDIIQGEWEDGKLYLARLGHEVHQDVPGMLDKYKSYQSLAQAPLEEIFGSKLDSEQRFEANWLAHTLFVNDGQGHFEARALPVEAQLTTGYGVVVADVDDDGHEDIFMVGNFYGPEEMHTGAFDGGIGALLRGDGKGGFTAVPGMTSGLTVPYDAKGLAATDYDQDGWVDLAVGVNNGAAKLFHNGGVAGRKGLAVRLVGDAANPTGVGARITVTRADGLKLTREVQAGSSFLSQNGTVHVFGLGESAGPATVTVRWPDGSEKTQEGVSAGEVVVITR